MTLHRVQPNTSWDLVNTAIPSFVPPVAKMWIRKPQGRTTKIIPNIHNPPEDNEILEIWDFIAHLEVPGDYCVLYVKSSEYAS